jgi:probable DNA repair protein
MPSVEELLASGNLLLAANDRTSRALAIEYGRRQQQSAWPAPPIFAWDGWIQREWQNREQQPLTLLTPWQERELWTQIIRNSGIDESTLAKSLAPLAQSAHSLLCDFSPISLQPQNHADWIGDAKHFSLWLDEFSALCKQNRWLPSAMLPARLTELLASDPTPRSALNLVGFDRLTPSRISLLAAWGKFEPVATNEIAASIEHRSYSDPDTEMAACAKWLHRQIEEGAERVALLLPAVSAIRGELERVLRRELALNQLPLSRGNLRLPFEFTEGIALAQIPLIQSALLFLEWLQSPLSEAEVLWLVQSGYLLTSAHERLALAQADMDMRRCNMQRTEWSLNDFVGKALPPESIFRQRIHAAYELLPDSSRTALPIEWAALVPRLMQAIGFPGWQPLSSGEKQASDRWSTLLDESAALGAATGRISLQRYLSLLKDQAGEVLFTQQSEGTLLQIMEPVAAAGQSFDAIWFLGASESTWPVRGNPNPLLPLRLQRDCRMPNSSATANWELAQTITTRIAHSADAVVYSYPFMNDDGEQRPSSLVLAIAGSPTAILPTEATSAFNLPLEEILQTRWIPIDNPQVDGGASVLTSQSNCAFLAFAQHRLGATELEAAQAGLSATERGQLLHKVLEALWNPTEGPLHGESESLQVPDEELAEFVEYAVGKVFESHRAIHPHQPWEHSYLELERRRIAGIVLDWLRFERTRPPFRVESTEHKASSISVGPLRMNLRLDRIDRIGPAEESTSLLIDYKTGSVSPSDWNPPRPKDPQLPLYAVFAGIPDLSGLVFASVRRDSTGFTLKGSVRNAEQVLASPGKGSVMVRNPLTDSTLEDWRKELLSLADQFAAGEAMVNPRDYPVTCKYCGLKSLCRVEETLAAISTGEEDENDEKDE